ncbi:MAG: ACP S-malonyltransferase [Candidatus Kapaibacterium sp.]|nr:ACP S-malonyltransferase [Bacteroidota bacterium]
MKTALLFSGQGSQYVGMASDIYAQFESAKNLIDRADEVLGYSLSDICFNGPIETLKETRYTQPALFVHEIALLQLLKDKVEFHATAGHSLGEFSALVAAKVLTFEDALQLVALRGKLMFEIGTNQPGAMAAIIGLDDSKVEELCESITDGIVVTANYNSPGQVVISGDAEAVKNSLTSFKEAGARMVTELPVSGAFHSPLMKPAQEQLAQAINATPFQDAIKDVYCNVSGTIQTNAQDLRVSLINQLVSPVRWTQTLVNMQRAEILNYIEIGPKNVLQGLVKRTLQQVTISGFDTAEQVRRVLQSE